MSDALNLGLTVTRLSTERTPIRFSMAVCALVRWYSHSTSPSSLTFPSSTFILIFSSCTAEFHFKAFSTAPAISASVLRYEGDIPVSYTHLRAHETPEH